jgi:hypothetical protein
VVRAYDTGVVSATKFHDHEGPVSDDDIDDLIERWHEGAGESQELHEFLGMTWTEYAEFTRDGTVPDWLRRANSPSERPT